MLGGRDVEGSLSWAGGFLVGLTFLDGKVRLLVQMAGTGVSVEYPWSLLVDTEGQKGGIRRM